MSDKQLIQIKSVFSAKFRMLSDFFSTVKHTKSKLTASVSHKHFSQYYPKLVEAYEGLLQHRDKFSSEEQIEEFAEYERKFSEANIMLAQIEEYIDSNISLEPIAKPKRYGTDSNKLPTFSQLLDLLDEQARLQLSVPTSASARASQQQPTARGRLTSPPRQRVVTTSVPHSTGAIRKYQYRDAIKISGFWLRIASVGLRVSRTWKSYDPDVSRHRYRREANYVHIFSIHNTRQSRTPRLVNSNTQLELDSNRNLDFNSSVSSNSDILEIANLDTVCKALRLVPELDGNPNILTRFISLCDQLVNEFIRPEPENVLVNAALINGVMVRTPKMTSRFLSDYQISERLLEDDEGSITDSTDEDEGDAEVIQSDHNSESNESANETDSEWSDDDNEPLSKRRSVASDDSDSFYLSRNKCI
ncbi:hypothetical protein ACJJTC_016077 [Scirpophaga incertulas]